MSQQELQWRPGPAVAVNDGEHPPVSVYLDRCEEGRTLVLRQGGGRVHLDASAAADLVAAVQAAQAGA